MKEALFCIGRRKEGWSKSWFQFFDHTNKLLFELEDHQWKLNGQWGKNSILVKAVGFWLSKEVLIINEVQVGSMVFEKWWSSNRIISIDGLPDYRIEMSTSIQKPNVLEVTVSEKDSGVTRLVMRKEMNGTSGWTYKYFWKIAADERLFADNRGFWLMLMAFSYFAKVAKGESNGEDLVLPE